MKIEEAIADSRKDPWHIAAKQIGYELYVISLKHLLTHIVEMCCNTVIYSNYDIVHWVQKECRKEYVYSSDVHMARDF